ncbi:DEAD/DEAH box helicase [uncultured Corynebacterium sp.]|uniref:DEAD/DEAH box helicase n=1 Tax=uncultured Corynebacterium sp. TaxID=159447 RepID=UPI0025EF34FB|nr:DEAD/DEAH box helicase [uncultured Corynebacterium sp.]
MVAVESSRPTFRSLGVAAEIVDALADRGIDRAFAIQERTLPLALTGKDLIGQARTGMGKTLGFGVPMLDRLFDDADVTDLDGTVRGLVVVPTRELCLQVTEDLAAAAAHLTAPHGDGTRPFRVTAIYGGVPFEKQTASLAAGTDVVVGTPGRLLDLSRQNLLDLSHVEVLVLDEADEMLDQGFLDDVKAIMAQTAAHRQTMLFSATMPGPVVALTRSFMHHPVRVRADNSSARATHATTTQIVFQSHRLDRVSVLARILQTPGRGRTIVFTRTKRSAAMVAEDLAGLGFRVGAVHGDMRQNDRERSLDAFRDGSVDIMVATDVAARGIDVEDVTHVINYQVPEDDKTYVHRIGRTGRAGHSGVAVTLVDWDDLTRWQAIDDTLRLGHPEPPRWFSTSPEFLAEFALPEDVTDRVGRPVRVQGSAAATAPARRDRNRDSRGGRRDRKAAHR